MLLAGVPSLLSGILLYEWKQQRNQSKIAETEKEQKRVALVKGVEALLRDRLIIGMEDCITKEYAPISTVEILVSMYMAYHNLGGNGIVTEVYKKFIRLPHIPPDHQQEAMDLFQFEKIDIENILVIIALSVSLIMAIFYGLDNLAMSIVTGLLGYIGGTIKSNTTKGGETK